MDASRADASDPSPATTVIGADPFEQVGAVIGPYKLIEQIGKGGFGLVFVPEQQKPVRRRVAIKVIKPGMDTHDVIARFEAERQALALMDHPNIARVFDAGTTDSGRPYFVMEFVRGVAITEFCDQNHLTPRERLELFVTVCQAVQHAHQKGIIHRDLEPSNVLVTMQDGKPLAKVIDFGVAKALHQQLTDKTICGEYDRRLNPGTHNCAAVCRSHAEFRHQCRSRSGIPWQSTSHLRFRSHTQNSVTRGLGSSQLPCFWLHRRRLVPVQRKSVHVTSL